MQCKEHELALKEEERKRKLEEELAKQYRTHSITARYIHSNSSLVSI